MKRLKFSENIIIDQSPTYIFDYTQDYNNRLKWDTFLKKAEIIDGSVDAGLGVKTYCVAKNGIGMETDYISFNRPMVTAIKMTKGPYLFKDFSGSWIFKPYDINQTKVTFTYSFQLSFPFNLFNNIIKNILRNNVQQRLIDLKNNIEVKD